MQNISSYTLLKKKATYKQSQNYIHNASEMHTLKQHQITNYSRTKFVVRNIHEKKNRMTLSAQEKYKSVNKEKGFFFFICVFLVKQGGL